MVSQYIRDLKKEFYGYNAAKLMKDLLAGLTVAAVALPLALAFGVSSGADAAAGLVTAIIAGLVITALSGASFQISGPTGTMTAVLLPIAATMGIKGVLIVTFLAGVLRIIFALLKLGRLVSFIPSSVLTGFTSGIAIIIAFGQLDNFFGTKSKGFNLVEKIGYYITNGIEPNWFAVGISVVSILFMVLYPKKLNAKLPSSLALIVLAVIANMIFRFPVGIIGEIPRTILLADRLTFADLSMLKDWHQYLIPALSVACLCIIETLLSGVYGGNLKGEKFNADRELIAQGIGNLIIPFFGGVPATAAIARTSVAIKSGLQTRLTGIIHAVGLLASMLLLAPVMSNIPLSALSGVLIVTAWRMNEWNKIRFIFRKRFKSDIALYFITLAATVFLDLTMAIVIGVAAGLVMFIAKSTDIDVTVEDVDLDRLGVGGINHDHNWSVVYVTGPMFFMTSETIRQRLEELSEQDLIIFSLRGVPMADVTSVSVIIDFYQQATAQGKQVLFSSIQPAVMRIFERSGLVEVAGKDAFYFSVDKVLKELL
ncbi:SulP family inorganic anion transporter [Oscillospiraceae bacterium PP1C4]